MVSLGQNVIFATDLVVIISRKSR